jgi:chemotaxis protein methyltransferase WspC
MGLHSATVGDSTIARAVEQRMRDCGIESMDDYLEVVCHSDTELDALIEAVVIPETWFFRDANAFGALCDWVHQEWLPTRAAGSPLRILSVPCSSGEEPYTLAMCLAECGVAPGDAQIDAVDISQGNLRKAASARYGANSFRGDTLGYRDRYFDYREPHYQLNEDIRRRANFQHANLLDGAFGNGRPPYRVIFCRNLLIYFDRPTQQRAIDQLDALLAQDGLLFLGHSETSLLQTRGFSPLPTERCFGYRRGSATQAAQPDRQVAARTRRITPAPATPKPRTRPFASVPPQPSPTRVPTAEPDSTHLLRRAKQLADQGHMDEAAACCQALLQEKPQQADAYYLLGVIREAAGNSEDAEQMFRKAVYLIPDHYEALVHLSVILERSGDRESAQRFLARATRAQAGEAAQGGDA